MIADYTVQIIITKEDAIKYLQRHGFVKVKRHWELPNVPGSFLSTQDSLQALCLAIVSNGLRRGRKILKKKKEIWQ